MLGLCQECRLSVHFRRNPYVKASLITFQRFNIFFSAHVYGIVYRLMEIIL